MEAGFGMGMRNFNEANSRLPLPYLRQITGYMGRQLAKDKPVDQFFLDHTYAKPWNSHPFASRTKPARLLFYNYPGKSTFDSTISANDEIDVESLSQTSCPPPYDLIKAKAQMNEWETHLTNQNVEVEDEDWEEKINKTNWTFQQARLFNKVIGILNTDYLAKLTYVGCPNEPVMRRLYVDKGAKRLRQLFAYMKWETNLIQWLHLLLLESLNMSYLATYLDMLHTLKAKVPALVNKIISVLPAAPKKASVSGPETASLWNKRPWDPIVPSLAYNKLKKLPGSPLILVVPFAPSQGICNQTKRMRFWLSQLANLGKVIPVTMYAPGGGRSAIVSQCMEHIIGATRTKVNELKENFPNRPIILVGWGVGSVVACHVALQERVAAVVCLGFQMIGLNGTRGDVDDAILESNIPTLFAVGQNSPVCKIDEIEEFREKMKTETSLVIVGGADEWLRINHLKKKEEGVNQTAVDRCLLDEISNFLGTTLTSILFHSHFPVSNIATKRPRQPISHENKRRKRKLDTILEFDDEGGVEAPASKWKAAQLVSNEVKTVNCSTMNISLNEKLLTPIENLTKKIDSTPKIGSKINSVTGKRSYVRKARPQVPPPIPIITESTSSDSSSTSFVSSSKSSCPEVEEVVVTSSPSKSSPNNNAAGLSFNIGFLSSLGQGRRTQQSRSTVKHTQSPYTILKTPEPKLPLVSTSEPTTPVLHLYKTTSGSKTNPVSIFSVPARSAFSVPNSEAKSTVVANYSAVTRTKTSVATSETQPTDQGSTMEPDQEQVQAIQKLQFHDFPLTTASLSKTTGGSVVTQAKILSNYNLDLKKLQSNASTCVNAKTESPGGCTLPLSNPITSYTISSMMSATSLENFRAAQENKTSNKRNPVSLIVLTPTMAAKASEGSTSVDQKLPSVPDPVVTNEQCEIKSEPTAVESQSETVNLKETLETESVVPLLQSEETKMEVDTSLSSNPEEPRVGQSIDNVVSTPISSSPKGKFKQPQFPTIASTRTRRIKTPKATYYDP